MKNFIVFLFMSLYFYLIFFSNVVHGKVLLEKKSIHNFSISSKYVAIETDLVVNDISIHYIYLYDVNTNEKYWIKTNDGNYINSSMYFPSISSDGKYLTFTSRADNITQDVVGKCLDVTDNSVKNCSNIYLYDVEKKESILIKYYNNNFNGDNYVSAISGDGKNIVFESISTNMINKEYDCSRINGIKNCINIYKYNLTNNSFFLISNSYENMKFDGNSVQPSVSYDGRYVTYQSNSSNLVSSINMYNSCFDFLNDNVVCSNVYLADTNTMENNILSIYDKKIFNDNSGNSIISDDGKFVAFESYATNLSKKRQQNIYIYDVEQNSLNLITYHNNILNNRDSFIEDISSDGKYILYRTASTNLNNEVGINLYAYNLSSKKQISISNNEDIFFARLNEGKAYYYNGNLNLSKIDCSSPIIKNDKKIFVLKNNLSKIKDEIEIIDNFSSFNDIQIFMKDEYKMENEGEYIVEVSAIDEFDNVGIGTITIIVLEKDKKPPVFSDLETIKIFKGSKDLNINNYISAFDEIDGKTKIYVIDKGRLNLNVTGSYKIKLMTKDLSNNINYKEIKVIVYQSYDIDYFCELIILLTLIALIIFSIIKVK